MYDTSLSVGLEPTINPITGQMWFDVSAGCLNVYTGNEWVHVSMDGASQGWFEVVFEYPDGSKALIAANPVIEWIEEYCANFERVNSHKGTCYKISAEDYLLLSLRWL